MLLLNFGHKLLSILRMIKQDLLRNENWSRTYNIINNNDKSTKYPAVLFLDAPKAFWHSDQNEVLTTVRMERTL